MDTKGEASMIFYETNLKVNNKKILNEENVFGIIDSGCPTTVAGQQWIDTCIQKYGQQCIVKTEDDEEQFKFGPSPVYESVCQIILRVRVG